MERLRALIQEIPNFYKVEDVLASYPLQDLGDQYVLPCPFHKDSRPSFRVRKSSGVYHCFSCNATGSLLKLMYKLSNSHLSYLYFAESILKENKMLQGVLGFDTVLEEKKTEYKSHKRFIPNKELPIPITTLKNIVSKSDNTFKAMAASLTMLQEGISPNLIAQAYKEPVINLLEEMEDI